jgi:8-oxo-dGTP diphosphatase
MITCSFEDGGTAKLRHIVVDSIVIKDNKILMVKRAPGLLDANKWSLIGGYMELDETIAQTAHREIHEETGWEVSNLQLLAIIDQPERPSDDRQNIAFVFFCEATEQTGKPDAESTEVKWFSFDTLPTRKEIAFDHAHMIDLYMRYMQNSLAIPVLPR